MNTPESPPSPESTRSETGGLKRLRTVARRIAVFMLVLVMLVAGGGGALCLLFNTSSGTRWLAQNIEDTINGALSGQGLRVAIERFEGPLPGALCLAGVTFYDEQGLWLHIDRIALDWDVKALFSGRVLVQKVLVRCPRLVRLPVLATAKDASLAAETSLVLPSWMPGLTVEHLSVEQATVESIASLLLPRALVFSAAAAGHVDAQGVGMPSFTLTGEGWGVKAVDLRLDFVRGYMTARENTIGGSVRTRFTNEQALRGVLPASELTADIVLNGTLHSLRASWKMACTGMTLDRLGLSGALSTDSASAQKVPQSRVAGQLLALLDPTLLLQGVVSVTTGPQPVIRLEDVRLDAGALTAQADAVVDGISPVEGKLELHFASNVVNVEDERLKDVNVRLTAELVPSVARTAKEERKNENPTARGALVFEAVHGHVPMRLDTHWQADMHSLRLEKLAGMAAGIALEGSVSVTFPSAAAEAAAVNGRVLARVRDWQALSAYVGPVQGTQAMAELLLRADAGQGLALTWKTRNLRLGEQIVLSEADGELTAHDVWGKLSARLAAKLAGTVSADVRAGYTGDTLTAAVHLADLPLTLARSFVNVPLPNGTAEATLTVKNPWSRPEGTFSLTLRDMRYKEQPVGRAPAFFNLHGRVEQGKEGAFLLADATLGGMGINESRATVRVPLDFSAAGVPAVAATKKLSGSFLWNGPLASLWTFVPLADRRLTGQAHLKAVLSGTGAKPVVQAVFTTNNAEYDDLVLGLMLKNMNLALTFNFPGLSVVTLKGTDGQGGTFALEGGIGDIEQGLPLTVTGVIDKLKPLRRRDVRISLSGRVRVEGPAFAPLVQASLTVNQGELRLEDLPGGSVRTLPVVEKKKGARASALSSPPPTPSIKASDSLIKEPASPAPFPSSGRLEMTVTVPNRFFVRGMGFESEWKGALRIAGPWAEPVIEGDILSVRGQFSLLGKVFTLAKGSLAFGGSSPPDPSLDVQMEYASQDLTATVSVNGTASHPSLALSSQPPMPQDEVVAQVLFGRSSKGLSRVEAIQVATALSSLAGIGRGGSGLMDMTRSALGLDVLRLGSGQTEKQKNNRSGPSVFGSRPGGGTPEEEGENSPTLEVGKYVLDNVYLGLEQGMGTESSGVRVEVELGPRLNLEARSSSKSSEVGINWKKDY